MKYFLIDLITFYGPAVLEAVLLILAGLLAVVAKKYLHPALQNKVVMTIAKNVVLFVEQTYKDLHGDEKLDKALEAFSEVLASKHIKVTSKEMRVMLEAALAEFNNVFSGKTKKLTE